MHLNRTLLQLKKLPALLFITLFITTSSYAQKTKIQAAMNYLRYEELDKAKEAIDLAVLDESTKSSDKAWYYRGAIYETINESDKFKSIASNPLDVALLSYNKALELDPNSQFKNEINEGIKRIRAEYFNKGVADFNNKSYNSALTNFENALKTTPTDSTTNIYASYSAERSGNTAKAIEHYQRVIDLKLADALTYNNLAAMYKNQKDTAKALVVLDEGRQKFPDNLDMMLTEYNLYIALGRNNEATDLLNKAIAKDPNNASLYFALGLAFDKLANPKDGSSISPEQKRAYLDKAIEAYKKAIEKKPDYFEANFNVGTLYFNQAAEMNSKISTIKDPKEYAEGKQKFESIFSQALPYFEKAYELNPKDHDTMDALKQIYFRQNNMEKYYRIKDKLDAEGK